jgi:hypothetical protein
MMTDQIEDILRGAPAIFKQHPLVQEFISKAQENMKLIEEQQLLRQNMAEKERAGIKPANQ